MNTMSMINLPANVAVIREEEDLKLLHYTDDAQHPGPADFFKGVVTAGPMVVARSFQWAPTVESYDLPEDLIFSRYHEATVLRFYVHDGQPMVSTHRQINIADKNSRAGTGRPFIELVQKAINAWPYVQFPYGIHEDGIDRKGLSFTPTSWKDLCIEGMCTVFLLMDQSNQITDLDNLTEMYELPTADGGVERVAFTNPKLLHIMTLYQDGDLMVPTMNSIHTNIPADDEGYTQYTLAAPRVELLSRDDALTLLSNGGAVVGFDPRSPDVTTKFFSPEYARKVILAGETFNPIFRWHELMDQDPALADEYLQHLPYHQKGYTTRTMQDIHLRYLEESANYLAANIIRRVKGATEPLDRTLYERLKDSFNAAVQKVRKFANQRDPPTEAELDKYATSLIAAELYALSFTEQHAIHGRIAKIKQGRL